MTTLFTARDHILIYASSIESDLRRALIDELHSLGITNFLTDELRENARKRAHRDENCPKSLISLDQTLVNYLDLGQLCQLIQRNKSNLFSTSEPGLIEVANSAISLIACRNRAIHGRALEYDDFPTIQQFAETALKEKKIRWYELDDAVNRLRLYGLTSSSVLIPSYWQDDEETTANNLPPADFTDTGWVGRKRDVENVKRLLQGSYPVISIVGEGGVGKTALALKVAYEILEETDDSLGSRFELIVWLTLKSSIFSSSGIKRISDSISDATTLFARLSEKLGVIEQARSETELVEYIHDYLSQFRTLLILDNLESIASEKLGVLLANIPVGTKVLITTRVALGQSERSYPLGPLEEKESAHLFRAYASALNCERLRKINSETIRGYCNRMSNNPLAIKWFVGSVANGKDPSVLITRHSGAYKQLLEFAFSDLYSSFESISKIIIAVVFSAGKELTRAEILWLVEIQGVDLRATDVESHLRILIVSSVLRCRLETKVDSQQRYELGAFAKQYISEIARPTPEFSKAVVANLSKMKAASADGDRSLNYDKWDYRNVIDASTPEERIVRARLLQATNVFRERIDQSFKISTALRILEAAEKLMPGYAETMRIRAQILIYKGDYWAAREEFERCLDVSPSSRLGRYAFAHTLIHHFEDYDQAIALCRDLVAEFPTETPPNGLYALALQRNGQLLESAEAFENIVRVIEGEPVSQHLLVRARLHTIHLNQAAETYRRLAELDRRSKNTRAFCEHIVRAIALSGLATKQSGGFGEDHRQQQVRNLNEGLGFAYSSRDTSIAVVVCEAFLGTGIRQNLSAVWISREKLTEICSDGACLEVGRYLAAAAEKKNSLDGESADHMGTIVRLFPDKRFGFIQATSGEELYFNFYDVSPDLMAQDLSAGLVVRYRLGTNSQGICAKLVRGL
jgi:LuxR family glucitol operon transcriptional activator